MPIDADQIKNDVDIVEVIGQFVTLKKEGSGFKGCCPFHDEKTGSFNVMPDRQRYFCHGCQEQGDVIDFISKHKDLDFKAACEFLGGDIKPEQPPPKRQPVKKKKHNPPVPLSLKDARNHYTTDVIQDRADFIFKDEPKKFVAPGWAYRNEDGLIELIACRFEGPDGGKAVLPMYWNGDTIKMAGCPVLLYNRDLLAAHPEKPVLIVEGEKTAEAGAALTDFVVVTWNGGHQKAKQVDLKPLKNREVFIFPDDDHQKYKGSHPRAGQVKPAMEQPGNIAAAAIKKKLPHAKIVKPVVAARKVKPSGADIVEVLEVMSAEEVTAHILGAEGDKQAAAPDKQHNDSKPKEIPDANKYPFNILGVADDGKAYFIGEFDWLYNLNPMSLSKTQLFNLASVHWWREAYGASGKDWEEAISDLITLSKQIDFDPERMRGRGAWREPDGRICYHDGKTTTGDYSKDRIYLRRSVKNIGLHIKPATTAARHRICESVKELTFDSTADCVRTLGWAALAPFAGALPWRPAGLMTAASGTGKSTIVNLIIKPLAMPIICSGGESTAAGIRQRIGVDSCAIVVEEAETDTPKKKQNRDDTFSLMRQSTSDDSPDVLKGTIDGRGLSFTLRSMFFFVSISPEVECEADENRIFRVSLVKASYKRSVWLKKERELKAAMAPEICAGVRAYTWANLPAIITLAERVATQAQLVAGADNRTAFAESLLLAAYMAVFKDKPVPTDDYIDEFVKLFYTLGIPEKRRNENEEMLDILLDAIVKGDSGHNYTIREVLGAIETGKVWSNADDLDATDREEHAMPTTYARRLAGMYGIGLWHGDIAIAKNHPEVMKILNKGRGYQLQLMRHPRLVERGMNVNLGSSAGVKNCVVIGWEEEHEV